MLQKLFYPSSIAVVGVSKDKNKVGSQVFHNIKRYGFGGACYPVNPSIQELGGVKCYPSVTAIDGPIDLCMIAIPSSLVPDVMEECGKKAIVQVVILSAGFRESGIEGARLEKEILNIAKRYGIRITGPNCLGVINTSCNLNATFARSAPPKGNIAFLSQSGAICTSILDWSKEEKIGFSEFASLGNKVDLSEIDFLRAFAGDPQTRVIAAYLEGVDNGIQFMKTAREIVKSKPVIAIKAGTTQAGARAVSSHTGTLAGADSAYDAAFRQSGIIRAQSIEDLFEFAGSFASQPMPKGKRVAILTNAGGPGIIATDACEKKNIPLAGFERKTISSLQRILPKAASVYNPVDILGDAHAAQYEAAARILLKDPNVHSLIVILTPQSMTEIEKTAEVIAKVSRDHQKPIFACFMGGAEIAQGVAVLKEHKIPHYYFPEKAVFSLAAMLDYLQILESDDDEPERLEVDKAAASAILEHAKGAGLTLTDIRAKQVLQAYGIAIPKSDEAVDLDGAKEQAVRIGYPVALKIAAAQILHKTDIGGVRLNIMDERELEEAYDEIYKNSRRFISDSRDWKVSIDQMIDGLVEVIIGVSRDPQFGPVIMFGLGGIFVEVLKDVSFRIAPFPRTEARKMVSEIRSFPILKGVRGKPGTDIDSIVEVIVRTAQLATDFPQIAEIDINPLKVSEKGSIAVDARILLGA